MKITHIFCKLFSNPLGRTKLKFIKYANNQTVCRDVWKWSASREEKMWQERPTPTFAWLKWTQRWVTVELRQSTLLKAGRQWAQQVHLNRVSTREMYPEVWSWVNELREKHQKQKLNKGAKCNPVWSVAEIEHGPCWNSAAFIAFILVHSVQGALRQIWWSHQQADGCFQEEIEGERKKSQEKLKKGDTEEEGGPEDSVGGGEAEAWQTMKSYLLFAVQKIEEE